MLYWLWRLKGQCATNRVYCKIIMIIKIKFMGSQILACFVDYTNNVN